MRVVLDTNVLVSVLVFKKRLAQIGDLLVQGSLTPCFVVSTWQEFESVLRYPKLQPALEASDTTAEEITQALVPISLILPNPKRVPKVAADIADNLILAAAMAAKASYVVTGDKNLLALNRFGKTPIVTPEHFLRAIAHKF